MSRQFEGWQKQHVAMVAQAKAENKDAPLLRYIPYSNRLKAQIKVVAKLRTKVDCIRDHHHKKNASVIADKYRKVAVEEHGVKFMFRNRRSWRKSLPIGQSINRNSCSRASLESVTSRSLIGQRTEVTLRSALVALRYPKNFRIGSITVGNAVLLPDVIM